MFDLTPKKLILDQLENRFKKLNLTAVMLTFDMETQTATCKGLTVEGKHEPIEITKNENTLIQKMLVAKIKKRIDYDFLKLVVNIDISTKNITLAVVDTSRKLVKIEL